MPIDVPEDYPGKLDVSKFRKQGPIRASDLKEINAVQNFVRSRQGSTIFSYVFDPPLQMTSGTYTKNPSNAATNLNRLFGAGKIYKPNAGELRGINLAIYGRNIEAKLTLDRIDGVSTVNAGIFEVVATQSTSNSLWVGSGEFFGDIEDTAEGGVLYADPAMFVASLEVRTSGGSPGYLFAVIATEILNDDSDIANGTV